VSHARSGAASEVVAASARAGEPDRYLAALLAPPSARPHLLALAAFSSELARVPLLVTREPAMGEIRLQWWRDALLATDPRALTGHPVADAVRATIQDCQLPAALLIEAINAQELNLARQGLADDAALAAFLWQSEGLLFALAAAIVSRGLEVEAQPAALASGQAYGLARLLIGLPRALARGRVPLPPSRLAAANVSREELLSGQDGGKVARLCANLCAEARAALASSRQLVANLPRRARPAFLPLALVPTYLRALERPARSILHAPPDVAPLQRVLRMAAAHWLGRL
jgi:15-cis-phytoene synthase